jgi:hypothetical protein
LKDVLLIPEWLDESASLPDIKRATFIFDDTESVSSARRSASFHSSQEEYHDWLHASATIVEPLSFNTKATASLPAFQTSEILQLRTGFGNGELQIFGAVPRKSSGFSSAKDYDSFASQQLKKDEEHSDLNIITKGVADESIAPPCNASNHGAPSLRIEENRVSGSRQVIVSDV